MFVPMDALPLMLCAFPRRTIETWGTHVRADGCSALMLRPAKAQCSAEAGAADFGLAEIFAAHIDLHAHLGETGTHAVADAIA